MGRVFEDIDSILHAKRWLLYITFFCTFIFSFHVLSTSAQAQTITEVKPGVPVSLRVHDTDLLIEGCVSPSSLVTIINDAAVVGSVTSGLDGTYSQILTAQTPTIHVIETFFEDPENRKSDSTNDLVALTPKTLTTLTANPPPTVQHLPENVESGQNITFKGYTCPNAMVQLVVDGNLTLTTTANSAGLWTITVNSLNFTEGPHSYSVVASGPGYTTAESQKYQFTVIPQAPSESTPPSDSGLSSEADLSIPVEIVEPVDGYRANTRDVYVTGTGPPNAQIELFVDGELVGSVFSNPFGEWSLILSILESQQELSARACNSLGCGDLSNSVRVFYGLEGGVNVGSLPGDCSLKIRLDQYRYPRLPLHKGIDLAISIEGADPRFDVITDWGDITIDHQTLDKTSIKLHHTYHSTGHYNGKVAVQSEGGRCKDVVYFSVRVVDTEDASRFFWYIVSFLIILTLGLYVVNSRRKAQHTSGS